MNTGKPHVFPDTIDLRGPRAFVQRFQDNSAYQCRIGNHSHQSPCIIVKARLYPRLTRHQPVYRRSRQPVLAKGIGSDWGRGVLLEEAAQTLANPVGAVQR